MNGEELPDSVRMGQRLTGMTAHQKSFPLAGSLFQFAQHGKCGAWVSDLLPHTARIVDELCFVQSMHTEAINHDPAITFFQTGSQQAGRPSHRRVAQLRPRQREREPAGFVVLISRTASGDQPLYARLWGSGFLPSQHQGVQFRGGGDPVLYLAIPQGIDRDQPPADARRAARSSNRMQHDARRRSGDRRAHRPVRDGLPHADERARADGPVARSRTHVFDLYGPTSRKPGTFAANCLLARRLAERDVRFIQLYHPGWDQHGDLPEGHPDA